MANKKSFSSLLVLEALEKLGMQGITSHDIRRLGVFAKDTSTATAVVKKLRNVVAQYRLNPCEVLEIRGVGPMTMITVHKLSAFLRAHEVKAEFGVGDNLSAVVTILSTLKRGASGKVLGLIKEAHDKAQSARNLLENEKLEQGLRDAITPAKKKPSKIHKY